MDQCAYGTFATVSLFGLLEGSWWMISIVASFAAVLALIWWHAGDDDSDR